MDFWIEKHAHLDPRLNKLNTALESESFLSYWALEKQWKRGRTAVKSVEGTIATWLKNSAERVRYTPNKQHKSDAEFLAELEQLNTNQKPIINTDAEVISDCEFTEIPEFL